MTVGALGVATTAVSSVAVAALVGRSGGLSALGAVAVAQSAVNIGGFVATAGINRTALRSIAGASRRDRVAIALQYWLFGGTVAILIGVLLSLTVAVIAAGLSSPIRYYVFPVAG